MIIYIMNNDYDRVDIITDYNSLIWTDRWNSFGDFELYLPASSRYNSIRPGTTITMSESTTPMLIETITRKEKELVFKGRSLEHIAQYVYFKKPSVVRASTERTAVEIFNRSRLYDNYDVTFDRNLDLSIFDVGLGSESSNQIVYETNDDSVFDQFKSLLDVTYSGYTLRKTNSQYGRWYIRVDRMRNNDSVALSTSLNDFESFENVRSISNYRNRAYVRYISTNGNETYLHVTNNQFAAQTNLPWEYSSRMVLVDATNINRDDFNSDEEYTSAVRSYGVAELSKYRYSNLFDGKLNHNMRYRYGTDYKLGDIIPVFSGNEKFSALVKEYIWSATKDSIEQYPTLEFLN